MAGAMILERGKGAVINVLQLFRPLNGLMASAAVLIGWYVSGEGHQPLPLSIPLLMVCSFCMVSVANIANDLDDVHIDTKAHPNRGIASGAISRKSANIIMKVIWAVVLISFLTTMLLDLRTLTFSICIVGFLSIVYYEKVAKTRGFIGNVIISSLTALPFLLGASVQGLSAKVLLICPMAFSVNLSREVLKDIVDMEGDRGFRKTLPLVYGTVPSLLASKIAIVGGMTASFLPLLLWDPGPSYIVPVILADLIFLSASLMPIERLAISTNLLKVGMVLGLLGFLSL